jgi:small Trp-rich protein
MEQNLQNSRKITQIRMIFHSGAAIMYFLGLGLVLLLLKHLEIGPVGQWGWASHWYWFAAPFIMAVLWWAWADGTGYTKRKAMEKMELRKQDRLAKNREALGIGNVRRK